MNETSERDRILFDRIAAEYSRKDRYPPSRVARSARLFRTIEAVSGTSGLDLLEIGCGAGFAARYLQGRYQTYTGIDHSRELIRVAVASNLPPNASFHTADLYDWRPDRRFDLVFAIGVLHHLRDIACAMSIICSALKPGGFIVVNEPQPANRIFHWLRKTRARIDTSYSADQDELGEDALVGSFKAANLKNVSALPQGLFSTPFAEVMLKPAVLTGPLSTLACKMDYFLETSIPEALKHLSWNLIVKGQFHG